MKVDLISCKFFEACSTYDKGILAVKNPPVPTLAAKEQPCPKKQPTDDPDAP